MESLLTLLESVSDKSVRSLNTYTGNNYKKISEISLNKKPYIFRVSEMSIFIFI